MVLGRVEQARVGGAAVETGALKPIDVASGEKLYQLIHTRLGLGNEDQSTWVDAWQAIQDRTDNKGVILAEDLDTFGITLQQLKAKGIQLQGGKLVTSDPALLSADAEAPDQVAGAPALQARASSIPDCASWQEAYQALHTEEGLGTRFKDQWAEVYHDIQNRTIDRGVWTIRDFGKLGIDVNSGSIFHPGESPLSALAASINGGKEIRLQDTLKMAAVIRRWSIATQRHPSELLKHTRLQLFTKGSDMRSFFDRYRSENHNRLNIPGSTYSALVMRVDAYAARMKASEPSVTVSREDREEMMSLGFFLMVDRELDAEDIDLRDIAYLMEGDKPDQLAEKVFEDQLNAFFFKSTLQEDGWDAMDRIKGMRTYVAGYNSETEHTADPIRLDAIDPSLTFQDMYDIYSQQPGGSAILDNLVELFGGEKYVAKHLEDPIFMHVATRGLTYIEYTDGTTGAQLIALQNMRKPRGPLAAVAREPMAFTPPAGLETREADGKRFITNGRSYEVPAKFIAEDGTLKPGVKFEIRNGADMYAILGDDEQKLDPLPPVELAAEVPDEAAVEVPINFGEVDRLIGKVSDSEYVLVYNGNRYLLNSDLVTAGEVDIVTEGERRGGLEGRDINSSYQTYIRGDLLIIKQGDSTVQTLNPIPAVEYQGGGRVNVDGKTYMMGEITWPEHTPEAVKEREISDRLKVDYRIIPQTEDAGMKLAIMILDETQIVDLTPVE